MPQQTKQIYKNEEGLCPGFMLINHLQMIVCVVVKVATFDETRFGSHFADFILL